MAAELVPTKKYNAKGQEVLPVLIFEGDTPNYTGYVARKDPSDVSSKTTFTFAPSKDFSFKFSKDANCDIDIWIHTNPKNIANNVALAMKTVKLIKKA